jgi:hypothetical protein
MSRSSNIFGVIDWSNPSVVQRFRWSYLYNRPEDLKGMTDFCAYLVHRAMCEHPAETISAPDHAFPDLPECAARTFAYLEARLAPFGANVPPLVDRDWECLAHAAELEALPDNFWHPSGRWVESPRTDLIIERMKTRIEAESGASEVQIAAEKKRLARQAKRREQLLAREERRHDKELEGL